MKDVQHRVMNAASRAIMKSLNEGDIQTASLSLMADEELDDVERLQNYGLSSYPPAGAQAAVIFLGGNRDHGLILSADDPLARKKVEEGEVALYSKFGQFVYLKKDGNLDVKAAKVSIKNGADDLVSLMVDLLAALEMVTVNTALGPQPFVNLAAFTDLKLKITAFKE